jgi:hypothetical protein
MRSTRVLIQKECYNCGGKGRGCNICGGSGWLELPPMNIEMADEVFDATLNGSWNNRPEGKAKTLTPTAMGDLQIVFAGKWYTLRNNERLIVDGSYGCRKCGITYGAHRTRGVEIVGAPNERMVMCDHCYSKYRETLEFVAKGALKGTERGIKTGWKVMGANLMADGWFHHVDHQETRVCREKGCRCKTVEVS